MPGTIEFTGQYRMTFTGTYDRVQICWDRNGNYLGRNILSEKEIKYFTSSHFTQYDNRRGVIFDKPSIDIDEEGPTCDSISHQSFGHSGWTGTLVWADPSTEIVYVFLSNGRAFPTENLKLLKANIRTNIQQIIYNSIMH